jgi:hypothetical protein
LPNNNNAPDKDFVTAANDYCVLIEQIDEYPQSRWLDEMAPALVRLEASIDRLQVERGLPVPSLSFSDLETRFELFAHLKAVLGELDAYWSEGDLLVSDGYKTGSLAEDFADIYTELVRGMMIYEPQGNYRAMAMRLWVSGYRRHWGQHLLDARKQLVDFRRSSPGGCSLDC